MKKVEHERVARIAECLRALAPHGDAKLVQRAASLALEARYIEETLASRGYPIDDTGYQRYSELVGALLSLLHKLGIATEHELHEPLIHTFCYMLERFHLRRLWNDDQSN
jgi:hypothetical protein